MKETFENYLMKNQIKPTKQRLQIASLVFIKDQHFTASDLIEKINIQLLRQKYNFQSEIALKKYKLDLNSREITKDKKIIHLEYSLF